MLHKLNATRTGSSRQANTGDYHIVFKDGQYRVFDKSGKFRLGFATLPAAQTYIDGRTAQKAQAAN
jgi:hypothetical protein